MKFELKPHMGMVALALFSVLALAYALLASEDKAKADTVRVAERDRVENEIPTPMKASQSVDPEDPDRLRPGQPRRPATSPFSHLPQSRTGLPLEDDRFIAESAEEQSWLDRNGYPNNVKLAAMTTASDDLLRAAADAGDGHARDFLDSRALTKKDPEAQGRLLDSARRGSLYAASLLAGFELGTRDGDKSLAYSLHRFQEMRGDSRASIMRDLVFEGRLTALERAHAEVEALRFSNTSTVETFYDPRPVDLTHAH